MPTLDRWEQYLFQAHSPATLREFAQRLRFFRFVRAIGGHANDGDALLVCFAYHGEHALCEMLDAFGVPYTRHSEPPPQSSTGPTPSLIDGTQWIEQPGRCEIASAPAFVWCTREVVRIHVGASYAITENDVQNAEAIEVLLERLRLEPSDPPVDNKHCICPKFYPNFFS